MEKIIILAGVAVALAALFITFSAHSQTTSKPVTMKMNAGIITHKILESKTFYQNVLGFGITFENEFYLLMHTPGQESQIAFLVPDHPTQRPIFQPVFGGKGSSSPLKCRTSTRRTNESKHSTFPLKLIFVMNLGATGISQ